MPNLPQVYESLDLHPVQLEIWRRQEPWQRLELAMALSQELVEGNFSELRRLHPEESEHQLKRRFAVLNYGESVAASAYGKP